MASLSIDSIEFGAIGILKLEIMMHMHYANKLTEITNSNQSTQLPAVAGTLQAIQADHIQLHKQHADLTATPLAKEINSTPNFSDRKDTK